MSGVTRDGTAQPVTPDKILRRERVQGFLFSYLTDHEQDWQPYPIDPYSAESADYTHIYAFSSQITQYLL